MQGILAGRYRLDRQLGKGGMGSVWLAEHLALNSWVAIKLMDPSIAATTEGAERFKREAQAAASLRSAHVVQVLDYGVHENTPFLVMELLQGQSLADCLEREKRLTPARTVSVVSQVARAIGRAHAAGIVHRDLKPDNIFLINEDGQELAKVLDFGIAKTTGPRFGGMETRTGVTMGTPYYMSPEQVEGKKALDHRSDLWSLAVIACECLTGIRPFDGETYGELLLNICARPIAPPSSSGFYLPGFDEWFAKAANRDTDQRFNSAQELASALADVVAGRAPAAAPATSHDRVLPGPGATVMFTGHGIAATTAPGLGTSAAANVTTQRPVDTGNIGIQPWPSAQPPRSKRTLRLVLGVLLGLSALLGLIVLMLLFGKRGTAADSVPETILPASAAPRNAAPLELEPALPVSASVAPSEHAAKATPATAAATTAEPKPATASPALPTLPTLPTLPAIQAAPGPAARAPATPRCFVDPFTGQVRLVNAGHAADSFPCKQNAFTGAYQRQ